MEILKLALSAFVVLVAAYVVVRILGYAACRSFFDAKRKEDVSND